MRSIIVAACLIGVVCSVFGGYVDESGPCGNNMTWSFDSTTGTLTINGTGAMNDYPKAGTQPWYDFPVVTVDIKEGVTTIGNYAFASVNCSKVLMPGSLRSIGVYAFNHASNLNDVTLPKGVEDIGDDAFSYSSLASVTLPDTVTSVGPYAFFQTQLTSLVIPSSVKTIDDFAFSKTNLKSVTVPATVAEFGVAIFQECNLLSSAVIEYGLTIIPFAMFSRCSNLKEVTIPSSVKNISGDSFKQCTSLTDLVIPDGVEQIHGEAFSLCTGLKSIVLPDTLTTIVHQAFFGCTGLEGIVFPASLQIIDDIAFRKCDSLKSVFFLGSSNIKTDDPFDQVDLENVCVPSDYNSSVFCGKDVTPETDLCKAFRSMTHVYSHCYEGFYADGSIIERKRDNATEWESHSTPCIDYICDNDTGKTWQLECNTSTDVPRMCLDNQCLADWESSIKGWFVEIGFEGVEYSDVNTTKLIANIKNLSGIAIEESVIGIEHDNSNTVQHIALTVTDEKTAKTIADGIGKIVKGEDCPYDILCHFTTVTVHGGQPSSSLPSSSGVMTEGGFIAVILLAFAVLMI